MGRPVFRTLEIDFPSLWQRITGRAASWLEIDYKFDPEDCSLTIDSVDYRGATVGLVSWDVEYRDGDPYEMECPDGGFRECVDLELKIVEHIGIPRLDLSYDHVLFRFSHTVCSDCCQRE